MSLFVASTHTDMDKKMRDVEVFHIFTRNFILGLYSKLALAVRIFAKCELISENAKKSTSFATLKSAKENKKKCDRKENLIDKYKNDLEYH